MPRAHEVFARARHARRWSRGTTLASHERERASACQGLSPRSRVGVVMALAVTVLAGCGASSEESPRSGATSPERAPSPEEETRGPQSASADVAGEGTTGSMTATVGGARESTGGLDEVPPAFTPLIREILGSEDARAVPEGTPPGIAATFRRIPLTVSDHGPVSGIGESGLHVDRMSVGTVFRKNRCRKPLERYAVSSGDDVSFCFRAVHRRIDETVTVHWKKEGRLVRRSFVNIPAIHAYRTRAKLALRREYVGWWDVIAMAADGTEIARARFEVVE